MSFRPLTHWLHAAVLAVLAAPAAATALRAAEPAPAPELQPSFPNHALLLTPAIPHADPQAVFPLPASRANPVEPADPGLPFSWDQTFVLREGSSLIKVLNGFDPDFQRVQYEVLPREPVFVNNNGFEGDSGAFAITARGTAGGNTEVFPFRVQARNIKNPALYNAIFEIREENTRLRGQPVLSRSPGDFIKPGQVVRYRWSQTGLGEKRPKCEAEFTGRTGPATGLRATKITEVLAIKVQPFVLGHYLMHVTPRDVIGEPARGTQSNGLVFRCAFGSENLPPATDGMKADTFTPAAGQVITLAPFAIDPETGQDTYENQTYDFGDGSVASGVSGPVQHAYAQPGIYRVRCTVVDAAGLASTAEDNVIVGAQAIEVMPVTVRKEIVPEEGGVGVLESDTLKATFKTAVARPGDRIVFSYNRNRFGRMSDSDGSDVDMVLKAGGGFTGKALRAREITVQAGSGGVTVTLERAQFDRTGDPRLGRADLKGIFTNNRLALCVIPADGSTPRTYIYTGNLEVRLKNGQANRSIFVLEERINAKSTTKDPDPRKQEIE